MPMLTEAEFRPLFDSVLEVDETDLQTMVRRGETVIDDQDLGLLSHRNRVALGLGPIEYLDEPSESDGIVYCNVPLKCVLHPSDGCVFHAARLTVDLRPTDDALVRDMSPRDVRGDEPVELTTTVCAGLKFTIVPTMVEVDARHERTSTRSVYHPTIVTSGRGFARAFWDFRTRPGDPLQPDRELRLLIEAPRGRPLLARFNLSARVTIGGAGRLIPLLRRRAEIDKTYQLA
jgi:hypothetical protein